MKRLHMATVAICLVATPAAPLAAAQPAPPGQAPHDQSHQQSGPRAPTAAHSMPGAAHSSMHAQNRQPARPPVGGAGRPAQLSHRWHSGDRFNGTRRPVGNWSHYHLRQPPAGYEWVQDGSQFVLIGIASGIIASVILNAASQ